MSRFNSIPFSAVIRWMLTPAVLLFPQAVHATAWNAAAGAQSTDEGIQALAFLPNELWVHVFDTITWTFPTPEIHTVTFLKQDTTPQQVRPRRPGVGGGCPGTTPDDSNFDGSACVTSQDDQLVNGGTYTVMFPKAGNFKLVCLVHNNMTGAVHVLAATEPLPFDQAFYDAQGHKEQTALLTDGAGLKGQGTATAQQSSGDAVTVGIGEIVATGGGSDTVSVMRFLQDSIVVRMGDTVEWTNLDPVTPHTVTFGPGPDPSPPQPPSPGLLPDSDGVLHAVLASPPPPGSVLHSGFLQAAFQDQTGLAQLPLGVTRFRVTFTTPGTFNYRCALHDVLGMEGRVIVLR
jgi:plastocyanin